MTETIPLKSGIGRFREAVPFDAARLQRASWASTTRRACGSALGLLEGPGPPQAGDLMLARIDSVGHHSMLQLPDGRCKRLFVGDEIVVAYGNRYAPNQFEAVVPRTLGPCQLVAAGGVAGRVLSWHASITKGPTQIQPIGLLVGRGCAPLNLRDHALPAVDVVPVPCPTVIAVAGTSMDSGKTETAAFLVRGLTLAGLRVGYAKVTGTGAGGDPWLMRDAGADPVVDFTDAGVVSTYLTPPADLQRILLTLVEHIAQSRVGAIVLELSDGVLQGETAALLESAAFREVGAGILFTAFDAMGAVAGHTWLATRDLPVIGLSGVLTSAPLQRREAFLATGLSVYSRQDLARPSTALTVLALADPRRADARREGAARDAWSKRCGLDDRRTVVFGSTGGAPAAGDPLR